MVNEDGNSSEHFIALRTLETADAMTICSLIKSVLTEYHVDVNKVYWQAYDGAANFSRKKNGVQNILRTNLCQNSKYIHCRNHLLNLACVAALKKSNQFKRTFSLINSVWRLFHQSPKRMNALHNMQTALNYANTQFLEVCDTRWTSHINSVNSIILSLEPLLLALEDIYQSNGDLSAE